MSTCCKESKRFKNAFHGFDLKNYRESNWQQQVGKDKKVTENQIAAETSKKKREDLLKIKSANKEHRYKKKIRKQ